MADVTRAQLSILDTNEPYVPVHINTLIVLLDAAAMELDEENIWCEETEALADALLTLFIVDPHVAQAVFERLCAWCPEVSDVLMARKEAKDGAYAPEDDEADTPNQREQTSDGAYAPEEMAGSPETPTEETSP